VPARAFVFAEARGSAPLAAATGAAVLRRLFEQEIYPQRPRLADSSRTASRAAVAGADPGKWRLPYRALEPAQAPEPPRTCQIRRRPRLPLREELLRTPFIRAAAYPAPLLPQCLPLWRHPRVQAWNDFSLWQGKEPARRHSGSGNERHPGDERRWYTVRPTAAPVGVSSVSPCANAVGDDYARELGVEFLPACWPTRSRRALPRPNHGHVGTASICTGRPRPLRCLRSCTPVLYRAEHPA